MRAIAKSAGCPIRAHVHEDQQYSIASQQAAIQTYAEQTGRSSRPGAARPSTLRRAFDPNQPEQDYRIIHAGPAFRREL
jgi:hypothetical protein